MISEVKMHKGDIISVLGKLLRRYSVVYLTLTEVKINMARHTHISYLLDSDSSLFMPSGGAINLHKDTNSSRILPKHHVGRRPGSLIYRA